MLLVRNKVGNTDRATYDLIAWECKDEQTIVSCNLNHDRHTSPSTFAKVFDPVCSIQKVYEDIAGDFAFSLNSINLTYVIQEKKKLRCFENTRMACFIYIKSKATCSSRLEQRLFVFGLYVERRQEERASDFQTKLHRQNMITRRVLDNAKLWILFKIKQSFKSNKYTCIYSNTTSS